MTLFDGYAYASRKEATLREEISKLQQQGIQLKIAALLFTEDKGSQLYTQLKQQAAARVGIQYEVYTFSMLDDPKIVQDRIRTLNNDHSVTGIIIQKPSKKRWLEVQGADHEKVGGSDAPALSGHQPDTTASEAFAEWWHALVQEIELLKDVDGLHPQTLAAIQAGNWRQTHAVMPATAKAVLDILVEATRAWPHQNLDTKKAVILGKSDILGQPLYFELQHQGWRVEMIGSRELEARQRSGQLLLDADVVVSATGRPGLITGELIKPGAIVIDVGEPKPDVDLPSVSQKASFVTPVPGGVGPVTVVSLLKNCVELVENRNLSTR